MAYHLQSLAREGLQKYCYIHFEPDMQWKYQRLSSMIRNYVSCAEFHGNTHYLIQNCMFTTTSELSGRAGVVIGHD